MLNQVRTNAAGGTGEAKRGSRQGVFTHRAHGSANCLAFKLVKAPRCALRASAGHRFVAVPSDLAISTRGGSSISILSHSAVTTAFSRCVPIIIGPHLSDWTRSARRSSGEGVGSGAASVRRVTARSLRCVAVEVASIALLAVTRRSGVAVPPRFAIPALRRSQITISASPTVTTALRTVVPFIVGPDRPDRTGGARRCACQGIRAGYTHVSSTIARGLCFIRVKITSLALLTRSCSRIIAVASGFAVFAGGRTNISVVTCSAIATTV